VIRNTMTGVALALACGFVASTFSAQAQMNPAPGTVAPAPSYAAPAPTSGQAQGYQAQGYQAQGNQGYQTQGYTAPTTDKSPAPTMTPPPTASNSLDQGAPAPLPRRDQNNAGGVNTEIVASPPQPTPGDTLDPYAAQRNVRESAQYEALVRSNPGFRAQRMARECGPVTDPQLHADCIASFNGGAAGSSMPIRR